MLNLIINGEPREIDAGRVDQLVESLGLGGQAVAVEVNQRVIRKAEHGATSLAEGDVVELVTLVGGG